MEKTSLLQSFPRLYVVFLIAILWAESPALVSPQVWQAGQTEQMCRSALSEPDRTAVTQLAEMRGFNITRQGIVYDGEDGLQPVPVPVAWHIVARRVRGDK